MLRVVSLQDQRGLRENERDRGQSANPSVRREANQKNGVTTIEIRQFVSAHRYRVAFYAVAFWLLAVIFAHPSALREGGMTVFENVKDALLYTRDGSDPDGEWPMDKVLDAVESGDTDARLLAIEELGRRHTATARVALLSVIQADADALMTQLAVRSLMAQRDAADEAFISAYVNKNLPELDALFVVSMFDATGSWMLAAMDRIKNEHPDQRVRQLAIWALNHKDEIANQAR